MSDDNLISGPTESDQQSNKTIKIIVIVVVILILCICLCLIVLLITPMLLGPYIGNVFSDIENQILLTPLP